MKVYYSAARATRAALASASCPHHSAAGEGGSGCPGSSAAAGERAGAGACDRARAVPCPNPHTKVSARAGARSGSMRAAPPSLPDRIRSPRAGAHSGLSLCRQLHQPSVEIAVRRAAGARIRSLTARSPRVPVGRDPLHGSCLPARAGLASQVCEASGAPRLRGDEYVKCRPRDAAAHPPPTADRGRARMACMNEWHVSLDKRCSRRALPPRRVDGGWTMFV
jgi:hypothetical protein